jgi:hypothetical protein
MRESNKQPPTTKDMKGLVLVLIHPNMVTISSSLNLHNHFTKYENLKHRACLMGWPVAWLSSRRLQVALFDILGPTSGQAWRMQNSFSLLALGKRHPPPFLGGLARLRARPRRRVTSRLSLLPFFSVYWDTAEARSFITNVGTASVRTRAGTRRARAVARQWRGGV